MIRRPPRATRFPYTTLVRSAKREGKERFEASNLVGHRGRGSHATGKWGGSGRYLRRHPRRSEDHTSELQSRQYLVCRLLLEKHNLLYIAPLCSVFILPNSLL